jgi:hypothetical protein
LATAVAACDPTIGHLQMNIAVWLDQAKLASWNAPAEPVPLAPRLQGAVDPRCRELARAPELDEDKRLRDQGWDLVGGYLGGWRVLVIRGTAAYDGMCRPRQYQDFVFVRGMFAGTLSPKPMDSRTDGALGRVFLENDRRLVAEYSRYATTDPLCCPSRTTAVTFEIDNDSVVLRPVSASTSKR